MYFSYLLFIIIIVNHAPVDGDRLSFVTSKIIFNFLRYFMELNVRKQSPYRFNLSYQVASYSKSSLAIARKKIKKYIVVSIV